MRLCIANRGGLGMRLCIANRGGLGMRLCIANRGGLGMRLCIANRLYKHMLQDLQSKVKVCLGLGSAISSSILYSPIPYCTSCVLLYMGL